MSRFLTPLIARMIDDAANRWVLESPLAFASEVAGRVIGVPAGFVTNFASVPRIPFAFWLTGDCAHGPAVIHDYLYGTAEVPRQVADAVFREAMEAEGIPAWRRQAMYLGVRAFGARFYGKNLMALGGSIDTEKQIAP